MICLHVLNIKIPRYSLCLKICIELCVINVTMQDFNACIELTSKMCK